LLQSLIAGEADAYLVFRRLNCLWCANNARTPGASTAFSY
jgi:hypothetical protein